MRSDCAAIVVKSDSAAAGGGIEEKTLRRLAFEVLEFVRGMGNGSPGGVNGFGRA